MAHISDHDLERYYLGMVADDSPQIVQIEEHLLWCRECQDRNAQAEQFVDHLRVALLRMRDDEP